MSLEDFVDLVERELLAKIYTSLKQNRLSGIDAQKIAQEFPSFTAC